MYHPDFKEEEMVNSNSVCRDRTYLMGQGDYSTSQQAGYWCPHKEQLGVDKRKI